MNVNTFRHCYTCEKGGSFTLINSKLVDTNSKYYQNAAINGGVFYCKSCSITLTNSEVTYNDAYNGGMLHSEESVAVYAANTTV